MVCSEEYELPLEVELLASVLPNFSSENLLEMGQLIVLGTSHNLWSGLWANIKTLGNT
jgi:hypothetical protein